MAFFDMDLGSPTLIGLEFIKNSLNVGSIIAFDEYYAYKGSLKGEYYAFEKFRENNIIFLSHSSLWVFKHVVKTNCKENYNSPHC